MTDGRVHRPITLFLVLAYAISWTLWAPAVLAHIGVIAPVSARYFHLAGALGPMISAIAVSAITGGRRSLAVLAKRCSTGRRWLLVAVLIPSAIFVLSLGIIVALYGEPIRWASVGEAVELTDWPRPADWLANLVFYGFGEETGWRGFALPRLQARFSALGASLLLTVAWAGWHLPLFVFSPGLSALGVGGAIGWLISLCLGSILLTWLFNSSGGSIAAVALFHAVLDIYFASPVATALPSVMGALVSIGTLLLVPLFGRANLARRLRVIEPGPGHDAAGERDELVP